MIMQAVVIEVQWNRLLVLDLDTRQRVIVNTPNARFYQPGALIRIWYNGAMTNSIPPQISALGITVMPSDDLFPNPPPVPCPQNRCPPMIRPPAVFPPIIRPPLVRPPSPPSRPRPPAGPRPPQRPRRRD